jgi:hypothetical protein
MPEQPIGASALDELQCLADAFARVVAWIRDPEAMESEAEMAEIADAALFRAERVLDRAE